MSQSQDDTNNCQDIRYITTTLFISESLTESPLAPGNPERPGGPGSPLTPGLPR